PNVSRASSRIYVYIFPTTSTPARKQRHYTTSICLTTSGWGHEHGSRAHRSGGKHAAAVYVYGRVFPHTYSLRERSRGHPEVHCSNFPLPCPPYRSVSWQYSPRRHHFAGGHLCGVAYGRFYRRSQQHLGVDY
ncbi:unnamed protein product, partial [Ectocarpus sp. 12 AP-2014]